MREFKPQDKPLVSVVIPIYNVEKYVAQCLDSIINQSYTNLEIICVNDGSTDSSGAIVQEYARKDYRIRYFEQENQGGGVARNTGLKKARGEWVLIFDSDDYMRSFAIESLLQRALQSKSQIVIAKSEELSENGNIVPMDWALRLDLLPQKEIFNYKDMGDCIFGFCVGWAWDKLYNRAFIESHNLRFEPVKSSDDLLFTFSSLVQADSISVCEKVLFTHRKHSTSVESSRDKVPTLFLSSVSKWRDSLIKMGIFSQVQRSFMNWTLSFCLWHLHTLKSNEAYYQLFVALKIALCDLGISHYPKAMFYDKKHYAQMRYILLVPLWLHKLNSFRVCDIKGIFRLRLSRNGSVIRIFGKTLYSNGKHYL
ncbi:glycosyltransferase family 2 protein [Helicobacter japonicus]|uniref:glycosyltransferase family 2 protein n=2 Tax=Helicobacter japonicus TaxID=425400 RepID=UPI002354E31F|nr:glycosyltransferase [Helicobacter japonicus]